MSMLDADTLSAIRRFVSLAGPRPSETQREMEAYAEEHGFPIIGPQVGGLLSILTRAVGARHAFEFGSGFGYSASWIAGALPADGQIVLTEYDEDELAMAREFAEGDGFADRAVFEAGDAMAVIDRYDGPFDIVLLDHEKRRYVDGFEAARGKLGSGGLVIADNMTAGPASFADTLACLEGDPVEDETARGVADYITHVRDDPAFVSTVVPMGNGIAVSVKRR